MMQLSRPEKEELVRDLYFNQQMPYHKIAKLARISVRDIKGVLDRGTENIREEKSKTAQAYDLFSQGKPPMEVAISLDLREPEVTQLFKESLNLMQLRELNRIYLETEGNLGPFLNLYKMAKAAGFTIEQVTRLIRVANKGLPELEQQYNSLKTEVDWLEAKKLYLPKIIQNYEAQISALGKTFDDRCQSCEQQGNKLADLHARRIKEESIVRRLENNKAQIKKLVEEKVHVLLSNRRAFLNLAVLCIIESIRENPEKYRYLVYQEHDPSVFDCTTSEFNPFWRFEKSYFQSPQQEQQIQYQSKVHFIEDYVDMLADDAHKLLEEMAKKLGNETTNEITNDHAVSKPLEPSSVSLEHGARVLSE